MKEELNRQREKALEEIESLQISYSKSSQYKRDKKAAFFLYMSLSFTFAFVEMLAYVEIISFFIGDVGYRILYILAPARAILGFGFVFDAFSVKAARNILNTFAYLAALPIAIITAFVNPQDFPFYLLFGVVVLTAPISNLLVLVSSLPATKDGIVIRSIKHQKAYSCPYGAIIPMFSWFRGKILSQPVFCPFMILLLKEKFRRSK